MTLIRGELGPGSTDLEEFEGLVPNFASFAASLYRSSVVSRLSGPGQVSANTKNNLQINPFNLQINPFFKQMPFSSTAIEGDDAVFEESDQVDVPPTLPQPPPNSR